MATKTTNIELTKFNANDYFDYVEENKNKDKLDSEIGHLKSNIDSLLDSISSKVKGTANFNGSSGITINHTRGNTNYFVYVMPTENPKGYLGEVWIEKAASSFSVKCSGTANTAFDYVVFW